MWISQPGTVAKSPAASSFGRLVLFAAVLLIGGVIATAQSSSARNKEESIKFWSVGDGKEIPLPLSSVDRSNINSLAFSPDGRILAGGTGESAVQLWNAKTGAPLTSLRGHTQSVESVAFSPDGRLLASGSYDKTVNLWEVSTGKLIKSLRAQMGGILSVAFSANGRYLASGSEDNSAVVYAVPTGGVVTRIDRHEGAVTAVAFSPDSQKLATGSRDKTVRMWELPYADKIFFLVTSHNDTVESLAFSPDGKLLASGSRDQTIKVWSLRDGRALGTLAGHSSAVNLVAFSPDGRLLASGSYDRTIKIWEVGSGRELQTLAGHGQQVTAIAFSPDGKTLASGSALSRNDNPALHVLAIGIGEYSNIPTVMYAQKDAKEFASALESVGRRGFERVQTRLLLGTAATKKRIIDTLNEIAIEAKPHDTFVFFYAGHGTVGEGRTEFNLVPFDAGQGDSKGTFIPASHLSALFAKIEARHQLVALDSAFGDRGFQSLVRRISEENKALDGLLQRDMILMATGMSFDSSELRNGALTHIILKGIGGDAASASGELTGRGLASYLKKSYEGFRRQNPRFDLHVFEVGNDFSLGYAARRSGAVRPHGAFDYSGPYFVHTSARQGAETPFGVNVFEKYVRNFTHAGPLPQQSPSPQPTPPAEVRARPGTTEASAQPSALPRRGTDYALLIAVSTYDHWDRLVNPVVDAEAIEKELKEVYGFKTQLLKDPTKQEITRALLKYRREITYTEDDQLFIFFAGHGHFNEEIKEGYLIAKDSLKDDEVGDTYYPHSMLRKVIDSIPCKHIFLVIDACYSGAFDEAIARRGGAEPYADATDLEFVRRKMQYKTRRFLTSGDKVYVPDGRPGQHSPFARKLLEALRSYGGADKVLTITGIYAFVERVTPEPRQGEWGDNEPGSDFILMAKPRP